MKKLLIILAGVLVLSGGLYSLYKVPKNIVLEDAAVTHLIIDNFVFKDHSELEVKSTLTDSTESFRKKLSEDKLRVELFNSEYASNLKSLDVDTNHGYVVFELINSNKEHLGTYKMDYEYSLYSGLTDYKLSKVPKKFK